MADTDRDRAIAQWDRIARDLVWDHPFTTAHEGEGVPGRWFRDGRLNAASNCLDRHLPARRDKVAVHWEGEPGDRRSITYGELHEEACALADALQGLGVGPGDRVALYLGWLPEAVVAMLACARLGAVHVMVPAPIPSDAVADRLADIGPRVVITQDGAWRHGVILPLKARADEALEAVDGIEHTIVVRRTGIDVSWYEGDRWYHEVVAPSRRPGDVRPPPAQPFPADHPLLIVHLSDRRGRPRAIAYGTAGLLAAAAAVHSLALTRDAHEVLWCPVDIAWAAGQAHGVYGPLLCGATTVMFEGMLDTPTRGRTWEVIQRYGVTTLLTTPSVWRSLHEWTADPPGARAASLRYVVTAGERTDSATRAWLDTQVAAADHTLVADGWGQTELGGVALLRPSHGTGLPDLGLDVVDDHGQTVAPGGSGELVVRHPWPTLPLAEADATARHWHHAGVYATSDLAQRRPDGEIAVIGRLDPMMSVSGQLVSATEVRDVLAEHPLVQSAEVIERAEAAGGEVIVACVVLAGGTAADDHLAADLRASVHEVLGGLATPQVVAFCERLDDTVARPLLRRALWRVVAGTLDATLQVSAVQLDEALRVAAREMT